MLLQDKCLRTKLCLPTPRLELCAPVLAKQQRSAAISGTNMCDGAKKPQMIALDSLIDVQLLLSQLPFWDHKLISVFLMSRR